MLAAALPYYNRHVCDILEQTYALRKQTGRYLVWQNMPEFRSGNDWTEPSSVEKIGNWTAAFSKPAARWIAMGEAYFFLGFFDPFPAMPLLIKRALRTGKKVYVATEGLKHNNRAALRRSILRPLRGYANGTLLAMGSGCVDDFRALGFDWSALNFGYAEKALKSVPHSLGEEASEAGNRPLRLLAVGQLISRKRYEWLVEFIAKLSHTLPIELRICGTGVEEERLRDIVAALAAPVELMGFCAPDRLARQYEWADIFIHPAEYEGWGVVLNHALSFGLPILAGTGVRSANGILVRDNWNGFTCATDQEYEAAVRKLHVDLAFRKQCISNSEALGFTWSVPEIARRLALDLDGHEGRYEVNEPMAKLSI
ncbi:MAG: hypothetical protein C0518_00955 [Opitutus sp.]|nr:hypothetical protein [Opitutus sp.]